MSVCVCAKGDGLKTHTDESLVPMQPAKHLWILLSSALQPWLSGLCVSILESDGESLVPPSMFFVCGKIY